MIAQRWLFLLFLLIVTDTVGSLCAAYFLYKQRGRNGIAHVFLRRLACLLCGIGIFNVMALVANVSPPLGAKYSAWYAWWYWSGRAIQSAMIWRFCLFLWGDLHNGGKS